MLDFIINPLAGGNNGLNMKTALAKVEGFLQSRNIEYAFHFTDAPKHAIALTDEVIRKGATTIIAVGGDGTLHEIINGFSKFDKVSLGILPCGTGNDFANALKLPTDPVKALELIVDGEAKYTDFMQMPTVRGLNIIGTGVDIDVLKRYESLKKKTKFGYTRCLIRALIRPKMSEFDSVINGKREKHVSFIACIANGHCYGGGIPICPIADPTDKKLDFLTVGKLNTLQIIASFMKLKKGKIFKIKKVAHANTDAIKILPVGHYTVNVDGELYDDIPFEVKLVSDTLKVFRP